MSTNCADQLADPSAEVQVNNVEKERPRAREVTIAILSYSPGIDRQATLRRVCSLISRAKELNADLVVLPSCFNCPFGVNHFYEYAELMGERCETVKALCESAVKNGVYIIGGSMPEVANGFLYETCPIIHPAGVLLGTYRRMHYNDKEALPISPLQESDMIRLGTVPTVVKTKFATIGIGIGVDIKSAKLAQTLAHYGCDIIVYPTGWHTKSEMEDMSSLAVDRAMESKCFVVTATARQDMKTLSQVYGRNVVIDPKATFNLDDDNKSTEGVIIVKLDLDKLSEIRKDTVSADWRPDAFFWDVNTLEM